MSRKLFKTSDKGLNPQLANDIATLRGGMAQAAERVSIPRRFVVEHLADKPAIRITDTTTDRSVELGLCDYYGARTLLNGLFGEAGQ